MISMISDIRNKSIFSITKVYVFAHQDDINRPLNTLDKSNIKMDTLAKTIATREIKYGNNQELSSNSMGMETITYKGVLVTLRIQHILYAKIVNSKPLQDYSDNFNTPGYLVTKNMY